MIDKVSTHVQETYNDQLAIAKQRTSLPKTEQLEEEEVFEEEEDLDYLTKYLME